jgi:hypothetical protein
MLCPGAPGRVKRPGGRGRQRQARAGPSGPGPTAQCRPRRRRGPAGAGGAGRLPPPSRLGQPGQLRRSLLHGGPPVPTQGTILRHRPLRRRLICRVLQLCHGHSRRPSEDALPQRRSPGPAGAPLKALTSTLVTGLTPPGPRRPAPRPQTPFRPAATDRERAADVLPDLQEQGIDQRLRQARQDQSPGGADITAKESHDAFQRRGPVPP